MAVFALADLHLALGNPQKSMEKFYRWKDYVDKIEINWRFLISPSHLVLIAGNISWALKPQEALADLRISKKGLSCNLSPVIELET